MLQRTLTIIKPDAVRQRAVGEIIRHFEEAGFRIVAARMVHLTKQQAEGFYAVHRERPFFADLTDFMSSGPCVPMVLEAEEAVDRLRRLMGATDPARAEEGTIRKALGTSVQNNVVHGSDSPQSAASEIPYFFNALDAPPAAGRS